MYKLQRPLGARARSAISARRRKEKEKFKQIIFFERKKVPGKCEHVRGGDSSSRLVEAAFLPVLNHSVAVGREADAARKKEGKMNILFKKKPKTKNSFLLARHFLLFFLSLSLFLLVICPPTRAPWCCSRCTGPSP